MQDDHPSHMTDYATLQKLDYKKEIKSETFMSEMIIALQQQTRKIQ